MDGWKALGLTEDQARVIVNYRENGGHFYDEEDLLKVYSLSKEHVRAWSDSLKFPDPRKKEEGQPEGRSRRSKERGKKDPDPFPFDPNELPKEGWTDLGLSPEQAQVVLRYRKAGGRFWEPSDLLDLYVVDTPLFRKWEPYVRIDHEALKLAIDEVGKEALKELPGVGKVLAGRIVEYRELLGGFHELEQLKEVYGVPDSIVRALSGKVTISEGNIDKIPLDTTGRRLMQHPYIAPEQAEAIVEHQKRYGAFKKKKELRALDLFGAKEYRKIAPYIELSSDER